MVHDAPDRARLRSPLDNAALPGDSDFDRPDAAASSVFELLAPLARRWRTIVIFPLALVIAATAYRLIVGNEYTAKSTFTQESSGFSLTSNLGALASIAGKFGIGGAAGGAGSSPDFYADVLSSRTILDDVLRTPFTSEGSSQPRSLLEIADRGGDSPAERMEKGRRWLSGSVNTNVDNVTGIVTLRVTMPQPRLSADVANRFVELLNQFNLERRQSQSREERKFTGARLAEAEAQLRSAEAAHRRFLENNRVATSPLLVFEEARRRRAVDLRQEIYEALSRKYEESRIAEVQDTPVITVIDTAVPPVKKSSLGLAALWALAIVFGTMCGVIVAYLLELWSTARTTYREQYDSLTGAWRQMRTELRRPWKRSAP
jgi:uncharacterized protein involved in exopolysaccharide biosynthesis